MDSQYKIELRVRNHNTLSRQVLIDTVVSCVPSAWTVDLEDAEVFFLVEVFKVRSLFLTARVHGKGKRRSADQLFRLERLWHWHRKGLLCASKVQRHGNR